MNQNFTKGNKNDDFLGLGKNISGPLTLNIDTSQFGRTFQDRSHVFVIRKVPENLKKNIIKTTRIVNLNVRGRRGNIVDVYPSVEYDFVPNEVEVKRGDYLHIQVTSSLTFWRTAFVELKHSPKIRYLYSGQVQTPTNVVTPVTAETAPTATTSSSCRPRAPTRPPISPQTPNPFQNTLQIPDHS